MSDSLKIADYGVLLTELKARIHAAQYAALRAVNKELLALYWDIGKHTTPGSPRACGPRDDDLSPALAMTPFLAPPTCSVLSAPSGMPNDAA